ncbi:MAG: hypothetical protein AAF629_24765 [Chloroflexota bacterium]
MNLADALNDFDGKHTDTLEALAQHLTPDDAVIEQLCQLTDDGEVKIQTATTWLLKRFQELGAVFSEGQAVKLTRLLGRVNHWEARLHLLQMLPKLTISANQTDLLHQNLKTFLSDDNKMVRAWSYNGLAVLADQHVEFQPEVSAILTAVSPDEAASVRARIRNIHKQMTWTTKS